MIDVVLIYPELHEDKHMGRMLPLSLLYPATPLARHRYRVKIIDQRIDHRWPDTLKQILKRYKNDLLCVGISSMTGPQIEGGLAAARIVKTLASDTPVIWGGVHPSTLPEQTLSHPHVDAVITGEGEHTLLETVNRLAERRTFTELPGLLYKSNGRVFSGSPRKHIDLNDLEPLAYELVKVHEYSRASFEGRSENWFAFLTSRGCPYHCTYCYSESFNKRRWRALRPERTIEDIERVIRDFSAHNLFLFDDNFFVDQNRVKRICELILERHLSITVHNANWRIDSILTYGKDAFSLLKAAGIKKVFVGVESGSDKILKRIGKNITCNQVLEANRKLKEAGIVPVYAFMVGFPQETRSDVKASLRLMNKLISENMDAFLPGMTIFSPFPGTFLFEESVQAGMHVPENLDRWATVRYDELNYKGFDLKLQRFIHKAAAFSYLIDYKKLKGTGRISNVLKFLTAVSVRSRIRFGFFAFAPELRAVWHKRNRELRRLEQNRLSRKYS